MRIKRSVLSKLFLWLMVYPAIPFVAISIGMVVYANWPHSFKNFELPAVETNTEYVVFIVHGKDDNANTWAVELQQAYQRLANAATQVFTLDWTPYSDNWLRCSVDGRAIGRSLGKQLATKTTIKQLHVIGHSAGAFVAYGLCEGAKQEDRSMRVQSTYLDPLSVYGAVAWDFGFEYFGGCADFSEAYIDIDSGVPGSQEPLLSTHTFDVTAARSAHGFMQSPHIWPIFYYKASLQDGSAPLLHTRPNIKDRYPPGEVTVIH